MAYRRVTAPSELLRGNALTQAMVGIGMRFAAKPSRDPNIEDTLLAASVEGMEHDDLRVLSTLVSWLHIHHPWINADRLNRVVSSQRAPRVRAFWAMVADWLRKDRRFTRMASLYTGPRIHLLHVGTEFHLQRKGEDHRFEGSCILVPAGTLRDRATDVVRPEELVNLHHTYRRRVLMGPTYRADMWAVLDSDPSLSASDLARRAYGSFATAWQVKHSFEILAA